MQASSRLGSSLLQLGKFVQLQPTCISACGKVHTGRPEHMCIGSAATRRFRRSNPRSHPAISRDAQAKRGVDARFSTLLRYVPGGRKRRSARGVGAENRLSGRENRQKLDLVPAILRTYR